MNDHAANAHERGILPLLMSMIGTRVELAAIDTEAHVRGTVVAMLAAFVAVVLALIAFTFIGIVVIVVFWDTHRIAAASAVLAAYLLVAAVVAGMARSVWNARPPAFAATLRELELDRDALRSRS